MPCIGIDYGLGRTNIDSESGIRFGVISQHTVGQAWYDDSEPDYGDPTCPKCGNPAVEYDSDSYHAFDRGRGCLDYACESCAYAFDSDEACPEEALGYSYDGDGYLLSSCLDSDIMVLKSPYYTFAQFCSPCVPGAGNLDSAMPDGVKTYCLGHDWFEDKAPCPVYRVADDQEV